MKYPMHRGPCPPAPRTRYQPDVKYPQAPWGAPGRNGVLGKARVRGHRASVGPTIWGVLIGGARWVPRPTPKNHRPLGTLWVMEISVATLVFWSGLCAGVLDKTPFLPGGFTEPFLVLLSKTSSISHRPFATQSGQSQSPCGTNSSPLQRI